MNNIDWQYDVEESDTYHYTDENGVKHYVEDGKERDTLTIRGMV